MLLQSSKRKHSSLREYYVIKLQEFLFKRSILALIENSTSMVASKLEMFNLNHVGYFSSDSALTEQSCVPKKLVTLSGQSGIW